MSTSIEIILSDIHYESHKMAALLGGLTKSSCRKFLMCQKLWKLVGSRKVIAIIKGCYFLWLIV